MMSNKTLTTVCVFFSLIITVGFGFAGQPKEMGLMILAGAIGAAFLNLDRLQRFKGAGFEAEMKKAVDEANATIAQLRSVAATTTRVAFTDLMSGNFLNGMTLRHRMILHDELIAELRAIGVSSKDVEKAGEMWDRGICLIFHRGIRHHLERRTTPNVVNMQASEEVRKASKDFLELYDFDNWKVASSDEMRKFIEEREVMNENVDELLKDYQRFEEKRDFWRRDIFESL